MKIEEKIEKYLSEQDDIERRKAKEWSNKMQSEIEKDRKRKQREREEERRKAKEWSKRMSQ